MRSNILLAAGSGSRMSPLTDNLHKSLLEINGVPLLERILNQILQHSDQEIVIVTGHRHEQIESMLKKFTGKNITTAFNDRYLEDVNIYSVHVGVSKLKNKTHGYNIIETDLILESDCWKKLYDTFNNTTASYWVTHGTYSEALTGGIVHVQDNDVIDGIAYAPSYMSAYKGWSKMLGILSVGPDEVNQDIAIRQRAIEKTTQQYYLAPWITGFKNLPCRALDVSEYFAKSFNDAHTFMQACDEFKKLDLN